MASSKKLNKSNDILHIFAIILLVIIICIIIYLIYKTLKGKGEFFQIIKTIENFEMKLSTDATLDQYKISEKAFQDDLKKDLSLYDTSYLEANEAYNKYNSDYSSIAIEDLQKRLDNVNSTISTINTQISNISTTESANIAKSSLDTLLISLEQIQKDTTDKKSLSTDLQKRGITVNELLQKASDNANIVINDINEGNKIRSFFTTNYINPFVLPKINAAQDALKEIDIKGKTEVENQIITSSKIKLEDTIKNINDVVATAEKQLDHSSYNIQKDKINKDIQNIETNKKTLTSYINIFNGILTNIQNIQDTCTSYQTNLQKIGNALTKLSQVILNYNELVKFNNDILALQPTK